MSLKITSVIKPGAFALGLILAFISATASAETHLVRVVNMKFDPDVVRIRPGDSIKWKNEDIVPHTITAESDPGQKPTFDSGTVNGSGTFLYKPGHALEIPYFCRFHPMMKGRIVIAK